MSILSWIKSCSTCFLCPDFHFWLIILLDNKKHFSQFSQIFPGILWTIYVFSVPVSPSFNLHCLVCAGWSELKFLQSFLWQTESLAFSWQKNSRLADCKLLAGRGRPSKVDSISLACLHELQGNLFPHFSSTLSQAKCEKCRSARVRECI